MYRVKDRGKNGVILAVSTIGSMVVADLKVGTTKRVAGLKAGTTGE